MIMEKVEAEMTKLAIVSVQHLSTEAVQNSPEESKRRGIGETFVIIADMGNFGRHVKLRS